MGDAPSAPPPVPPWAVKRLWDHPCYLQRCRVNSAEASGVILGVPAYPVKKLSLLNFSSRSTRIKINPYSFLNAPCRQPVDNVHLRVKTVKGPSCLRALPWTWWLCSVHAFPVWSVVVPWLPRDAIVLIRVHTQFRTYPNRAIRGNRGVCTPEYPGWRSGMIRDVIRESVKAP